MHLIFYTLLLLLSSGSSERCPSCPASLCPGEVFTDCSKCSCSCKTNKDCADGWKCDNEDCLFTNCDLVCVKDGCVEYCNTEILCGNFQCHKDPTAKCVVDRCSCKASFVDANGNEPKCLDGPEVAEPPPDWFPPMEVTTTTEQANVTMATNRSSEGLRSWTIFIIIPLAIIAVAAVISALVLWQKLWRKRNSKKKNESLQEESLKPLNTKNDVIVVV